MGYIYVPGKRNMSLREKPVLLLHCKGADQATSFPDSSLSNHTFAVNGNAQVDTAQSKWGGASLFVEGDDGSDNRIYCNGHTDFDIGAGNFTWDFWLRLSTNTQKIGICLGRRVSNDPNDTDWQLYYAASTGVWTWKVRTAGDNIVTFTATLQLGTETWYHVALCKVGDEYGFYINGVQKGHVSDASTQTISGGVMTFGAYGTNTGLDGWMDEIRIVQANAFGAAPVVGLTDTIKVPYKPYISWR